MKPMLLCTALFVAGWASSQRHFVTADGELIPSFAGIDRNGLREPSVPRFTALFRG